MACHITQRGVDRRETYSSDQDRSTYLRLLQENLPDAQVHLLGWFLMSNHVHLIAVPERADSLAVLFACFLVSRRIIHSPFGLALRGIRENALRMPALGAPSRAHLRKIYTISAVMAGVAGALLAQTTETVSLESLGFQRSADVLVILILGGAGRLYGGLVGAIIFMVARDQFSGNTPQFWYFWIGMLLVVVVMFLPNGILGGLAKLTAAWHGSFWRGK